MRRGLAAPFAEFFQRDFPLHFADVFSRPIVIAFAYGTLETDEVWLGHNKRKFKDVNIKKCIKPMVGIEPTAYSFTCTSISPDLSEL